MTSSTPLDRRAVLKGLAGGHAGSAVVGGDGEGSRGENSAAGLCDVHGQRHVVAESETRDRQLRFMDLSRTTANGDSRSG